MKVAIIRSTGSGLSYQDGGRLGWTHYGLPASGAMDRRAMIQANTLIGNTGTQSYACTVEAALMGAEIELLTDGWIGLADAFGGEARYFKAGEILSLSAREGSVWCYAAIPGGWTAKDFFGSRSSYLRAGLGNIIRKGSVLRSEHATLTPFQSSISKRIISNTHDDYSHTFSLFPGPQFDSFSEKSKQMLVKNNWLISKQSDRTGYRLDGQQIEEAPPITSEAVIPGSIQIPPNGKPIVTMTDGPTVGGYPKIAWMDELTRSRLAQCPPDSFINFHWAK